MRPRHLVGTDAASNDRFPPQDFDRGVNPSNRRRVMSTATSAKAQHETPSSHSEAIEVGNGATRYDWSVAFSRMCMRREYPACAIAAAMRLAECVPRGGGEFQIHRRTMAAELGVSERTIDRAYQPLRDDGWITTTRGGRDDPVTITLMIPPIDAAIHRFGVKKPDAIRDSMLARLDESHTRQKPGSYATQNGVIRDTQCGASNEQVEQKEEEQAEAARHARPYTARVGRDVASDDATSQALNKNEKARATNLYDLRRQVIDIIRPNFGNEMKTVEYAVGTARTDAKMTDQQIVDLSKNYATGPNSAKRFREAVRDKCMTVVTRNRVPQPVYRNLQ